VIGKSLCASCALASPAGAITELPFCLWGATPEAARLVERGPPWLRNVVPEASLLPVNVTACPAYKPAKRRRS